MVPQTQKASNHPSLNPFAEALRTNDGDQDVAVQEPQEELSLSNDLFRQALEQRNAGGVQTAEDPNQTEAILRREKLIREQHEKINPTQENVVELHARKEAETARELNELQNQFIAMAQAKEMPRAERPKILEASVVAPGENGNVFTGLMAAAKHSIEMFVPQPPHVIAKGRQARREGLIASADQDREEQMKMHHEFSVNGGA
jgi:hypothetical protein